MKKPGRAPRRATDQERDAAGVVNWPAQRKHEETCPTCDTCRGVWCVDAMALRDPKASLLEQIAEDVCADLGAPLTGAERAEFRNATTQKPVTFYRVSKGVNLVALAFAWDTSNRGGWRAVDGGCFVGMPPGTPAWSGVPQGWYASKEEAVEAEVSLCRLGIADALAFVAREQDRIKALGAL